MSLAAQGERIAAIHKRDSQEEAQDEASETAAFLKDNEAATSRLPIADGTRFDVTNSRVTVVVPRGVAPGQQFIVYLPLGSRPSPNGDRHQVIVSCPFRARNNQETVMHGATIDVPTVSILLTNSPMNRYK